MKISSVICFRATISYSCMISSIYFVLILQISTLVSSLPTSSRHLASTLPEEFENLRKFEINEHSGDPDEYIIIFQGFLSDLKMLEALVPHKEFFRSIFEDKSITSEESRRLKSKHHVKRGLRNGRKMARLSCQRKGKCRITTCPFNVPLDRISFSTGFGCRTRKLPHV
uniref:uncharacterized protein LOC120343090 n=1 Tax=Styela clava TaxID=7725 RepID=UPI00193AC9B9|nr:uncharacterized protein LOC120343090 [Styela clava]